jgi:hypothetical protein
MIRADILFETNRFNLSEVQPHFINDICFGEDAAAWLRERLMEIGTTVAEPAQEDWGWYIEATHDGASYFVGIGGNPQDGAPDKNAGEWRVMIEKHRSFWEKLTSKNQMAPDDTLLLIIRGIIEAEPDFSNVRQE